MVDYFSDRPPLTKRSDPGEDDNSFFETFGNMTLEQQAEYLIARTQAPSLKGRLERALNDYRVDSTQATRLRSIIGAAFKTLAATRFIDLTTDGSAAHPKKLGM